MRPPGAPNVVSPPVGIEPARPIPGGAVVVRAPDHLADGILALPALTAIAERFESRPVVVIARDAIAPLYTGQRGVSEVTRISRGALDEFGRVRRGLAGRPAGLGIVCSGFGSAAALAGAGVREVWGYGGPVSRMALDVALPRRWIEGRHRWEAYALLAAAATGREVPERYPLVRAAGDEIAASELLAGTIADAPLVGLVATAGHPARRWPAARFAELASRLGREGVQVVAFGAPGEEPRVEAVARAADPPPLDLAGRTPLPVLIECLRRLDVLVTHDTGPMHAAAAVGTPVVALFGASSEIRTGPRGRTSEAVVHPVSCRPCLRPTCAYNHGCMTGIGVDAVLDLVRDRLSGAPVRAVS